MASLKSWIKAARLRTLPLALASIAMGGAVAARSTNFNLMAVVMAAITTLFLQILSNMANDFGDSHHGLDNEGRLGPKRTVQTGEISRKEMKTAIILLSFLSLLSGLWLILGIARIPADIAWVYIALGLAAIAAAIKYTVGKNPYGYIGLGDLFVFLFFGLTGVLGTYYLATVSFDLLVLLPASALGLLSAGVLNLNNMRDMSNDEANGKNTLAVFLGQKSSLKYHAALVLLPFLLLSLFIISIQAGPFAWLFMLSLPLFVIDLIKINRITKAEKLDPFLKKLALKTLLLTALLVIGLNI
ncbi:MAG: 1,4-dihydroxy-2-naphthoate octaprenyltransferase [Bacteroidales bacterium]|nr:1,4-dihydroxy-2-naphthoate octaprenyltransferase [Bacteroidales bacterium]